MEKRPLTARLLCLFGRRKPKGLGRADYGLQTPLILNQCSGQHQAVVTGDNFLLGISRSDRMLPIPKDNGVCVDLYIDSDLVEKVMGNSLKSKG